MQTGQAREMRGSLSFITGTAVCGTARTVVWEDGAGNRASYPMPRRSLDRSGALLYPQPGGCLVGQGPAEVGRVAGRAFRGFEERRQSGKRLALGKLLRVAQAGHGEPGL